jgi:hypothetical protein
VNTLLKTSLLVALAAAAPAVQGDPPKAEAAKPAPSRSVFVMPSGVRDGRDPFFPESARPYEDMAAAKHVVEANSFVIKGFSVERGRAMVIINNHTFSLGDEGDVLTTSGRVHLRLTEIRHGSVMIEVNGSTRELRFAPK